MTSNTGSKPASQENTENDTSGRNIPLRLSLGYILFSVCLFYAGPFEWPLPSFMPVTVYLTTLLIMLAIGYSIGTARPARHLPMDLTKAIFLLGATSAIILIIPSSITYTGRWPWQVLEALADQREAYSKLRDQLIETEGGRGLVVLARTITYPLVFAVLPLGCVYWGTLDKLQRILLVLTVLCSLIFSALRGTTRELADVVIIAGSAFIVSIYRKPLQAREDGSGNFKYILSMAILASGVVVALVVRTAARAGDVITQTSGCIGEGLICVSYEGFPYNILPDSVNNIIATISGYLSQGYYGLALALRREFIWTKGIGHSPALQQVYELITGDPTIAQDTYVSRLLSDGWSGDTQWASLPTWLASDLSFWLVPGALLVLGYLLARSWRDATTGQDDRALVFFCALMMIVFYFPANNQMMYTLDNYAALLGWGLAWGITRRNAGRVTG